MKTYLKHNAIERAAYDVSSKISLDFIGTRPIKIGAVPRGGIPCLYILMLHLPTYYTMCDDLSQCDIIIDDIVDSGETKKRILELYPKSKFYAFFENSANWLIFPYENSLEGSIDDNITRIIQYHNITDPNHIDHIRTKLLNKGHLIS